MVLKANRLHCSRINKRVDNVKRPDLESRVFIRYIFQHLVVRNNRIISGKGEHRFMNLKDTIGGMDR